MIPVKYILKLTVYIRGGCSPILMKKHHKTFINTSAMKLDRIIGSERKIDYQIEVETSKLIEVCDTTVVDFAVSR